MVAPRVVVSSFEPLTRGGSRPPTPQQTTQPRLGDGRGVQGALTDFYPAIK